MERKKRLLVLNWKMAPKTSTEARSIFIAIKRVAGKARNVQTVVCPPTLYLQDIKKLATGHRVVIGAQSVASSNDEEQTGELGSDMVVALGIQFVILGHSERRRMGETEGMVNEKVRVALKSGLHVVMCFGEELRDGEGLYLQELHRQLTARLSGVATAQLSRIIFAYEPLWAIGKSASRVATPHDVHEVVVLIKKLLQEKYGKRAPRAALLYGGSVNSTSDEVFWREGAIDGFLLGRSGRDPIQMEAIVRHADKF